MNGSRAIGKRSRYLPWPERPPQSQSHSCHGRRKCRHVLIGVEYWVCRGLDDGGFGQHDEADSEHIQIGTSKKLALEGPQIVDLASVRRHRASINR